MNIRVKTIFFLISLYVLASCSIIEKKVYSNKTELINSRYLTDIETFKKDIKDLSRLISLNSSSPLSIQKAFLNARCSYKKIEFLAEYFTPSTAKAINGPPIDEVEEDDPLKMVIPPEGLQVIEELIFPEFDAKNKKEVFKQLNILSSSIHRLKVVNQKPSFTEAQIFDAVRLQIIRIISLGISGFDSPIAKNSIQEANTSLLSLKEYLNYYNAGNFPELNLAFDKAHNYLISHTDFNSFDRLAFIRKYLSHIYSNVYYFQKAINIPFVEGKKALNVNTPNLFSAGFNPDYFAPDLSSYLSDEKIRLGKILFFDPVLSGNGQRSCASCHNPDKGFTDHSIKSIAFNFKGMVKRNAPTVINAGLQNALFHDSRVMFLEDQATDVLSNENEMHGSMKEASEKVRASQEYIELFKIAFPDSKEYVSEKNLKIALASFTRSLISLNAPFDKYLNGDSVALNSSQVKGFNLFMGKAKCGTCHFMPLFNGVVPPAYEQTESEVIGVPFKNDTINAKIDPDEGKYLLFKAEKNRHAFKTPTLRNIAITAPYMHNGVFKDLEEVIDFYNRGGGRGIGINLINQTLPEDKLNLSKDEKESLIGFMKSLTDTVGFTSRPASLPAMPEESNTRKIGGVY